MPDVSERSLLRHRLSSLNIENLHLLYYCIYIFKILKIFKKAKQFTLYRFKIFKKNHFKNSHTCEHKFAISVIFKSS